MEDDKGNVTVKNERSVEKMDEEAAKKIQQKYLELQLLDQQAKQVQKQIQAIELQLGELDLVQASLDDFATVKPGSEAFVTITPGILAKSELKDNKNVFLNVGSGVVVQKSIPEAKQVVAAQAAELRKVQGELAAQLEKLTVQAGKVEEELRKLVS